MPCTRTAQGGLVHTCGGNAKTPLAASRLDATAHDCLLMAPAVITEADHESCRGSTRKNTTIREAGFLATNSFIRLAVPQWSAAPGWETSITLGAGVFVHNLEFGRVFHGVADTVEKVTEGVVTGQMSTRTPQRAHHKMR